MQEFPKEAQKLLGDEIQLIQYGGMPTDAKRFKGAGSGVIEIALRHDTNAYRAVLAVQLEKNIYVLHAFQKKSKTSDKTPLPDLALIEKRYLEAKELVKNEEEASH